MRQLKGAVPPLRVSDAFSRSRRPSEGSWAPWISKTPLSSMVI